MTTDRAKLRNLRIDEFSLVDKACQEPAIAVILKRDPNAAPPKPGAVAQLAKNGVLTTDADGHTHLLDDGYQSGCTTTQRDSSGNWHDHPYTKSEDGAISIGAANGHTHDVATPTDKAAPRGAAPQETAMTTDADRIKHLEAELTKAQTRASLTDIEKAHADRMSGDDQRVYLAKSATERKADAEARFAPVYKSATGEVYTGADDPRLVEMAKRADADRAEAEQTRLEKRADSILKHTGKTTRVRAAMLKAFDGIADDQLRKEAHEALVAADHALSGAYELRGFGGGEPDENSADAQLAKMAADHAAKSGTTVAKAKVWLLDNEPKALELKKRADVERKAARRGN